MVAAAWMLHWRWFYLGLGESNIKGFSLLMTGFSSSLLQCRGVSQLTMGWSCLSSVATPIQSIVMLQTRSIGNEEILSSRFDIKLFTTTKQNQQKPKMDKFPSSPFSLFLHHSRIVWFNWTLKPLTAWLGLVWTRCETTGVSKTRLCAVYGVAHHRINTICLNHMKYSIYAAIPELVPGGEVSKLWLTKGVAVDKHGVMTDIEFLLCAANALWSSLVRASGFL